MSGARLALHLALELQRRGGGVGAAALCGGGGQGDALIIRVPKAEHVAEAPFVFQALAVVRRTVRARPAVSWWPSPDHPENTDNAFVLMRPDEFDGPRSLPVRRREYTLVTGSGKTTQGGVMLGDRSGEDTVEFTAHHGRGGRARASPSSS